MGFILAWWKFSQEDKTAQNMKVSPRENFHVYSSLELALVVLCITESVLSFQ